MAKKILKNIAIIFTSINVLLCIIAIVFACLSGKKALPLMEYSEDFIASERYINTIITCLEDGDKERLEALFSEEAREDKDFEEDLDMLFEMWGEYTITDRNVLEYRYGGGGGAEYDYSSGSINHIGNGEIDGIRFYAITVAFGSSKIEGIINIDFIDSDNEIIEDLFADND